MSIIHLATEAIICAIIPIVQYELDNLTAQHIKDFAANLPAILRGGVECLTAIKAALDIVLVVQGQVQLIRANGAPAAATAVAPIAAVVAPAEE